MSDFDAASPAGLSGAERLADAAVHWTGLALAGLAVPALIFLAARLDGSASVIAGVTIYGAGLLAGLGASAAYNLARARAWRAPLRRLDHAAIFIKIAATQTPFAVLTGGGHAPWILGGVWATALGAATGKLLAPQAMARVSLPLYLALGWAGMALFWPGGEGAALAAATVALAVLGGALYTIGVGFFLAERLRFHNAIWHGFVLAASMVFFAAVTTEIGLRAAAGP